ncbi:Gamma-glutamylputrescine oxidoreductase [Labrenzia sp. THAF82]|uniref:NAD(P)/FAD-dependent oxidoreductase n=1 Tax=Labrenzia sp. THAF82 TaxID=2587861 RepID=UPI0012A8A9BE|nr:FAD-binding oxidoreductase [Labrenzia sp. THAF82]QFT32337.1 Gamma-glutamylputrescine oxidoreductase [Labrenzia sp. THAF82]
MTRTMPISLWDVSAEERDLEGRLPDGETFDVVIVGGGFTGLSTALHCAEAGLSACVIEANHVGFGGSGRNVGLVNAGIWLPPTQVREKLGATYGPRFLQRFGDGPAMVFDLIEKYQIRCEATRNGTIHAAHAPSGFRDLEARWKEWNSLGEPVDLLGREEISEKIGTRVFHGGLVDHRAGTVNPMGYCRGLARAATAAGATISTGVKVTSLAKSNGTWSVQTDKGKLDAKAVVLGTNAYTDDLWPGLKQTFTMIHYFQLATEPLGERASHILPERQGLWDTAPVMFSLRRDNDDRLIIGSMGKVIGDKSSGLSQRWARKQLSRLFPDLGDIKFEEAWHGQIAMTPDHLPRIHVLDEGLYTPIGYNGRGITTGTIFGQGIAGLLTGMNPADLPLPMTDVAAVTSAPLMSRFYNIAFTANQFIKGF